MSLDTSIADQNLNREDHVLIVTIVESDFAQRALEAARAKGAEGCTIVHGRGKRIGKAESIFHMPLDLPRDLVLTVAHKDKASAVQDNIFEAVGLRTPGHGFVYQLPVSALAGILCTADDAGAQGDPPPGASDKEGSG